MMHYADWVGYWASRRPHWPAVIDHDRSRPYSYSQLNAMANGLVHQLRQQYNLQAGDRIAMLTENCVENLAVFSACQKTGWVLVPLNYRQSEGELVAVVQDAKPALTILQTELYEAVMRTEDPPEWTHGYGLSLDQLRDTTEELARRPGAARASSNQEPLEPDHPLLLLYTSGTSGEPKGVIYSYRMLFWNAINTWMRLDITSNDRTVNWMPAFHTAGWNVLVTPLLHHGATVIQQSRFDPGRSLRALEQYQATIFMAVPTMLRRMVEDPYFHEVNLRPARYAIAGGEMMSPSLSEMWSRKGVPVRQGYGLSEAGPNITSLPQEEAENRPGSIGTPNFYVQWALADDQGQLHERPNEVGELYIGGPVVTPGYWNHDRQSHMVAIQGRLWLPTGDLVRMCDEGFLYVVDRKSNRYISGGENVFPSEVERILAAHPAISEVAVIACADPEWGEVGVAFIVTQPHIQINEQQLRRHAQTHLASYKIPKVFHFIEELPKNDTGKVDRQQLSRHLEA